jgi:hypothetical protein
VVTSSKWEKMIVTPERVDEFKRLGGKELPDNFNGGLRYTAPPNTNLDPLKAYWTPQLRDAHANSVDAHSRSSSPRQLDHRERDRTAGRGS